tara:strand:+ start:46 stop:960 length:915 start_codon:yes stop_codon:yes gene_type:complete
MAGSGGGTNRGQIDPGSDLGTSPITDDLGTSSINFGGKSPIKFIQFLLGENIFDTFGDKMLNEAFERAFIEVSAFLRDDVMLENLIETTRYYLTDSNTYGASNFMKLYPKRILKVSRQNTAAEDTTNNDQYYYNARKVQNLDSQAINPNSIYYENDPFNPGWYVDDTGGLKIIPKDSSSEPTGKVYYVTYPVFGIGTEIDSHVTHNLGEQSGLQNFSLVDSERERELFIGIPQECRIAVYICMAYNLLDGYLSNHIQEEEDMELVTLLKAQSEWLAMAKLKELGTIKVSFGDGQKVENESTRNE